MNTAPPNRSGHTGLIDPEGALTHDSRLHDTKGQADANIVKPHVRLRGAPDNGAPTVSELLYGEPVARIGIQGDWIEVASLTDGYRGWLPRGALTTALTDPTHRISAVWAHRYAAPDIKAPPLAVLPLGALVAVTAREGRFVQTRDGGWMIGQHLCPVEHAAEDAVGVAEMLLGSPYLWGGRTPAGLDCSALVQIALDACGLRVHRDSDLQQGSIGHALPREARPQRGDLAFFPGHVGFMVDESRLIHANATHMAVTVDTLETVIAWVAAETDKPPFSGFRRTATGTGGAKQSDQ